MVNPSSATKDSKDVLAEYVSNVNTLFLRIPAPSKGILTQMNSMHTVMVLPLAKLPRQSVDRRSLGTHRFDLSKRTRGLPLNLKNSTNQCRIIIIGVFLLSSAVII